MKKNKTIKYILLYLPFITGTVLYSFKIYNLFSSLLFFIGGYVILKNTFNYRKIKNKVEPNVKEIENIETSIKEKSIPSTILPQRTKSKCKIKKRIKH